VVVGSGGRAGTLAAGERGWQSELPAESAQQPAS
jgi:hypothetical protein